MKKRSLSKLIGRLVLVLTLVVVGLAGYIFLKDKTAVGSHPEFGTIYRTFASEPRPPSPGKTERWIIQKTPDFIKRSAVFPRSLKRHSLQYLNLEGTKMEWTIGGPKTGWLYFWDAIWMEVDLWEFAPSAATNLSEVTPEAIPERFYGHSDPEGAAKFGSDWDKNAVGVRAGQAIYARRSDQTNKVYVLFLKNQQGAEIEVNYCVVDVE